MKAVNAMTCGICGAPADKLESGSYQCQKSPGHVADDMVGIWSDRTRPGNEVPEQQ